MKINIVELYREIGKLFRENGAEQVALLSSKNLHNADCEMRLEIAADGSMNMKNIVEQCYKNWPQVEFVIYDLNNEEKRYLIEEINEGGIVL